MTQHGHNEGASSIACSVRKVTQDADDFHFLRDPDPNVLPCQGAGPMKITKITVADVGMLQIVSEDGRTGLFDVRPYMESEAFRPLKDPIAFAQVLNGGYYRS